MRTTNSLLILSLAAGSLAVGQTVKIDKLSIRAREFTKVEVTKVEVTKVDADRAMVRHSGGVARVPIADLPEEVRKSLGWKSEEEMKTEEAARKAEEDAKYPRLVEEWDLKMLSDRKVNETLRAFLEANPKAVVLRLVVVVRGNGAEWNKAFIYDREKKHLLAMTRTLPPKGLIEYYQTSFWNSVPEEQLQKGIPWLDDRGEPIRGIITKNGESAFDPPISYKDRPEITEWP